MLVNAWLYIAGLLTEVSQNPHITELAMSQSFLSKYIMTTETDVKTSNPTGRPAHCQERQDFRPLRFAQIHLQACTE